MKRTFAALAAIGVVLVLTAAPALAANGVTGGVDDDSYPKSGSDQPIEWADTAGKVHRCLDWDSQHGCKTEQEWFGGQGGTHYTLWISLDGRHIWRPSNSPSPAIATAPTTPTSTVAYLCPDGTEYYYPA